MNQKVFPMLGSVPSPELLDEALIERCQSFVQALGVSRSQSRVHPSNKAIAAELGLQPSVWSRIANKPKDAPAYMPEDKLPELCNHLGNVGVLQWLAYRAGFRLVPIAETRAQRLRRELAELEMLEAA
jgi:hypothetical protein